MSTPTKTIQTALLTVQSLASNSVVISSALDVSTAFAALVLIHFGRRSASALTEGVEIRVEGSAKSSGDGHWFPLASFKTKIAAVGDEAVNGTCNASQAVVAMASTTGFVVGDIIYIDNGTIGNSEFHRIKTVTSNTSVTLEDSLVNAQTGATCYASAEMFTAQIDLLAVRRIRLVANGCNTGQAIAIEAEVITCDSIS